MVNDILFRSRISNPTLPPNFMQQMWEDVTTSVNFTGKDPVFAVEELKKVTKMRYFILLIEL